MPIIPGETVDLATGVDRFLTSMPAGYYTIANVEGLKNQLKNPQTLLVDVREPSEYRSGHIPNAINIPLRTLTQNLDQIPRSPRSVVLLFWLPIGHGGHDIASVGL
jgi:rhodanese-related sulfurtransferase